MRHGYGITAVQGSFVEGYNSEAAREVAENSWFVINLPNKPDFKDTIVSLGRNFNQDDVIYIERGGNNSVIIGASKKSSAYFKLGDIKNIGAFKPSNNFNCIIQVDDKPVPLNEVEAVLQTFNNIRTNNGKYLCDAISRIVGRSLQLL